MEKPRDGLATDGCVMIWASVRFPVSRLQGAWNGLLSGHRIMGVLGNVFFVVVQAFSDFLFVSKNRTTPLDQQALDSVENFHSKNADYV